MKLDDLKSELKRLAKLAGESGFELAAVVADPSSSNASIVTTARDREMGVFLFARAAQCFDGAEYINVEKIR